MVSGDACTAPMVIGALNELLEYTSMADDGALWYPRAVAASAIAHNPICEAIDACVVLCERIRPCNGVSGLTVPPPEFSTFQLVLAKE